MRLAEARARVVEPVAGGGGREGRRGGDRGGGREKRKSTRKLKRGDGSRCTWREPGTGDGAGRRRRRLRRPTSGRRRRRRGKR